MLFAIAHASEEWVKVLLVIMGVTIARVIAGNQPPPPPPPPFPGLPFLLPVTKTIQQEKDNH